MHLSKQTLPKNKSIFFNQHSIILIFVLSILSTSVWASGNDKDNHEEGDGVCSNITKAAYKACKNNVRDDYWINYGNCINTDDKLSAKECIKEAKIQKEEDLTLCGEQKYARGDICSVLGEAPYNPEIDPANFLDVAGIIANPNPYFPLTPGLIKVFQSGEETIIVTVTDQTKVIEGVTTIVVRDTVAIDGVLVEDTDDWYAQDIHGNVWYFGELSRNYEEGELTDLDGSWKTGVDSAQPGILMYANPQVGDTYRQEFLLGEAEDMGAVLSVSEYDAFVPAADCSGGCIVTRDYLPIEPDSEENKYYAPGIGFILGIDVTDGEREELVEIIMP